MVLETSVHLPRVLVPGFPPCWASGGFPSSLLCSPHLYSLLSIPLLSDASAAWALVWDSIEEATKKSKFTALTIKGSCLGAWGAAFIARGARIEGVLLLTSDF